VTAVLVDGAGRTSTMELPQDVATLQVPVPLPLSLTLSDPVGPFPFDHGLVEFERLAMLPDERIVYTQRGMRFCVWTLEAAFAGALDENGIQALAQDINRQIAALTDLAPTVRLYDITTPLANGGWQREVWGVGRPSDIS
jgi:hypothetical protein